MMKVALLAAFLAVAVADPCCTPSQWEGKYDSYVGTASLVQDLITEVSGTIAYDFTNKMSAMTTEYTYQGQMFMNKTIINYNTKKMYIINEGEETCIIRDVEMDMMEACIPPGSEESEPFHIGAGDNNMLDARAYDFKTTYMGEDIKGSITVTNMDCVPVTEVVYGKVGDNAMMTTLGYLDIVPEISNPSVFDPPSGCAFEKEKFKFTSPSILGFQTVHKH